MLIPEARSLDLGPVLADYAAHGFARLGPLLDGDSLAALRERADDLMLGRVRHEGLFFQHDGATGRYEDLPFGEGWVGPSLAYRKIEKLERDPVYRALLENELFERIAHAVVGPEVTLYRALLMAKGAQGGTLLPWHQDGGRFWGLDRDPTLQIWVAIDDAPIEAGCVEVLDASHTGGLATPLGGMIPAAIVEARGAGRDALALPARAGDGLLIHNYLWHRSGVNRTDLPRRAVTFCYLPASTRCLRKRRAPRQFVRLFDPPR